MNVFYTNSCPIVAAKQHVKKHQIKMIVEYAQMLSTAHFELDGIRTEYKPTHKNHPSSVWVRSSVHHYNWVVQCGLELCRLYTEVSGKTHKTQAVLERLQTPPVNIQDNGFEEPPVAAQDEFKAVAIFHGSCIAYQRYLIAKFKEWQERAKPIKVEWTHGVPAWYINNRETV